MLSMNFQISDSFLSRRGQEGLKAHHHYWNVERACQLKQDRYQVLKGRLTQIPSLQATGL